MVYKIHSYSDADERSTEKGTVSLFHSMKFSQAVPCGCTDAPDLDFDILL